MYKIDEKDAKIINLLQKDCRLSFTKISREIGISIDAVKKRYNKLIKNKILNPKIQIRPRTLGFPLIADVKIKFSNFEKAKINKFFEYGYQHSRISELFATTGSWDCTLVVFAKNHTDLGNITREIRSKFSKVIGEWNEAITTKGYKFEDYNLLKLMEFEKNGK